MAALERRLPEPVNMGVVGKSIVVVMNMETEVGARCGLLVVGEAVNTAIVAAKEILDEFDRCHEEAVH